MQSLLHTTNDVELRLFRRDLRTIERALARGPCHGTDYGCCGVSLAQCHALLAIGAEGSGLGQLGRELEVEASTLTRTLDGLERLGLVERVAAAEDRRALLVKRTEAGGSKLEEIDRIWNDWFGETLATMSPEERRAAVRGIAALASAFRASAKGRASYCAPKRRERERS